MTSTTFAPPLAFSTAAVERKDAGLGRLPSLDGWRAVSILLVLVSHNHFAAGFPEHLEKPLHYLFDGHLGVRFFFVISGLLITWLMIGEEKKSGEVNLRHFYARRALRILPVYGAFLIVMALIQYFTPCDHSVGNWIANLTFTRNFYLDGNKISGPLWSLAVEEQFYLIWPFVFVWLAPAMRARVMPFIAGGAILTAFITRYLWQFPFSDSLIWQSLFREPSFFNNADSLAIGCLAAIVLAGNEPRLRAFVTTRRWVVPALGVLMLLEPYVMHWLTDRPWMPAALKGLGWAAWFGLGRTIQSLGFTLLLLQSILLPSWGLYRCLNWRPVATVGVLSYSLYIWQSIFYTHPDKLGLPDVWWMTYPLWMVPAFGAAIVSYHYLEKPFLKLRHRFR